MLVINQSINQSRLMTKHIGTLKGDKTMSRLYYGQKVRVWYKGNWTGAKRQLYPAMVTDRVDDLTRRKFVKVQVCFKIGRRGEIKHNCAVPPGDIKV